MLNNIVINNKKDLYDLRTKINLLIILLFYKIVDPIGLPKFSHFGATSYRNNNEIIIMFLRNYCCFQGLFQIFYNITKMLDSVTIYNKIWEYNNFR